MNGKDEIKKDFNLEINLAGQYHGRELYELIQNAADAVSDGNDGEGRITLWVQDRIFYCANTGSSIDESGVRALGSAFISSKPFSKIGHFGIGFKAVLNLTEDPQFMSTDASFRFDRNNEELHGLAQGLPGYPKLCLHLPITDRIEDSVLDKLMQWATTVVRMPLRENVAPQSIIETFTAFPLEFLLFSFRAGKLTFQWESNNGPIVSRFLSLAPCAEANGQDISWLSENDQPMGRWRVFKHTLAPADLPPGAGAPFREGQIIEDIPISWAVPLGPNESAKSNLWAFFPTKESIGLGGILNAPWATDTSRQWLDMGDKRPYNECLLKSSAAHIAADFLELRASFQEEPGSLLDLLPSLPETPSREAPRQVFYDAFSSQIKLQQIVFAGGDWRLPNAAWMPTEKAAATDQLKAFCVDHLGAHTFDGRHLVHPSLLKTKERRTRVSRLLNVQAVGLRELLLALVGNDSNQWPETSRLALQWATIALTEDPKSMSIIDLIPFLLGSDGTMHKPSAMRLANAGDADIAGYVIPHESLRTEPARTWLEALGLKSIQAPTLVGCFRHLLALTKTINPAYEFQVQQAWGSVWEYLVGHPDDVSLQDEVKTFTGENPDQVWVKNLANQWKHPRQLLRVGPLLTEDIPSNRPYLVDRAQFGTYADAMCNHLKISADMNWRSVNGETWCDIPVLRQEFRQALRQKHPMAPAPQDGSCVLQKHMAPGPLDVLRDPIIPATTKQQLVQTVHTMLRNEQNWGRRISMKYQWGSQHNEFIHFWNPSPMFVWAKNYEFDLNPPPEPPSWATYIRSVVDWYDRNRETFLEQCAQFVAPVTQADLQGDAANRDLAWLKLFVFAGAHSVGFGRAGTARSFVSWCERRGILDRMLRNRPDPEDHQQGSAEWIRLLWEQTSPDAYDFDYTFRTQFAPMFRMVGHLGAYRDHLLAFNDWPEDLRLDSKWVTDPNQHPVLPGFLQGRFRADLPRIVGPKGTLVLLRELQRMGLLTNPQMVPYCFVPSARLLLKLGLSDAPPRTPLQSSQIFGRITESLGSDYPEDLRRWFDIPFSARL